MYAYDGVVHLEPGPDCIPTEDGVWLETTHLHRLCAAGVHMFQTDALYAFVFAHPWWTGHGTNSVFRSWKFAPIHHPDDVPGAGNWISKRAAIMQDALRPLEALTCALEQRSVSPCVF